ncbi:homeodomain-like protein [Tanacetum coccineum]
MLRVFPISLTGAASHWLRNEPTGLIKIWEDLKTKFLNKYCPPGRTAKKIEEINNFQQEPDETLFQAWEHFKKLSMKCPQHLLTEMQEVILFYNGLDILTRQILDSRGRSPETFDGLATIQAQLNNLRREIKKVNEKVYAAQVGCEQCKGPHYTKVFLQKEEGKTLEEAYYTQFSGPFQGGGYRAIALGYYQRNNANPSYQERRQSMEDTLIKFMSESAKRHEEILNLIKEIRATRDAAIRSQGASIKTLEIQIGQMSKNSILLYKSRQTTVPFPIRFDNHYCEEEEGNYRPKFMKDYGASHINSTIPQKEKDPGRDFINLDMPEDIKVPLILGRPFLSTARAKFDVYKRKITLRVREEKIIFKSVKRASSLIKKVYMLSLRERIKLDLEARLMRETLVLNRSLDPFLEDYIDLNDLNEPFKLRRNQGDDLMPTIKEGKVIEEFRTRDEDLDIEIDDYPSYYDDDKKIHIDCSYNLKFSCMTGFEFTHVKFYPLLYVNVMSRKFLNSIMKEKMVYKGDNVVGALMNMPIFVGTFYIMTNFVVLEDMDAYCDEGMGDISVGEPFLREVGIKAKRFKGIITLYNGDDEVTYQMVQSHPRFKNHTNKECNKIPPLLKVSEKDMKNGISHAYQKLKGFYKGVLNLGPNYIRIAKTEEWLIHGHISMHEME